MNRRGLLSVLCVFFLYTAAHANLVTEILYDVNNLGSGRYQFTYDVININLPEGIEEFTIWFDYGLYGNLTVETQTPLATDWAEMVWQPEPAFGDDGAYDAQALASSIVVGQTISGFAVSFDWLGVGEPGSQFYEIVDPVSFEIIDSGHTIPEPATLFLCTLGFLVIVTKRSK